MCARVFFTRAKKDSEVPDPSADGRRRALEEPGNTEDREEATIGKRALMYFPPPLNGHYAGIIGSYGGSKYGGNYYHVAFDDGDEGDYTWREIQLGMWWQAAAGFTPAPHDEELPAGPISSAGGLEWGLKEIDELTPRMPGLAGHYESTDGCGGQFQGEPNYGLVARGATGASAVRRHSIIDEKNHGKNVSDPLGGQFQARLSESVAPGHEVFPGTRNCILYMAQYHPRPAVDDKKKPTTWSTDTKIYAYYSPRVLTKKKK